MNQEMEEIDLWPDFHQEVNHQITIDHKMHIKVLRSISINKISNRNNINQSKQTNQHSENTKVSSRAIYRHHKRSILEVEWKRARVSKAWQASHRMPGKIIKELHLMSKTCLVYRVIFILIQVAEFIKKVNRVI